MIRIIDISFDLGAKCSSMVECPLMVRWVTGAISCYSQCFTAGVNKGNGMYYLVCWMVHVKEPLLIINGLIPPGGPIKLFLIPTSVA